VGGILKKMKKTILLIVVAVGLIALVIYLIFSPKRSSLNTSQTSLLKTNQEITPSKTLKSYSDPSGFTFNYPDNLSLQNNESTSSAAYADIQLTSKDVGGSLNLKISDTKFATVSAWAKSVSRQTPKEVSLGNLKALEVTSGDKVFLGAVDSGVLFNIEIPVGDKKDFWINVYSKVIQDFSFTPPQAASADEQSRSSAPDDVSFEGEEAVQ